MRNYLEYVVVVLLTLGMGATAHGAEAKVETDICVYGGTSGGVIAAVQAARMGKRVILVEPGAHLGGMTSGGLSAVDIGDPRSVGGLAREYFTRLVAGYGKELDWDKKMGHGTGGAYSIEPHVAEGVFDAMADEVGVVVVREAPLASVVKDGNRIQALVLRDGRAIRARVFIDTTYEGDLLAAAGVTYTVTREGNGTYGEKYNGIYYEDWYRPRRNHEQPGANGRVSDGQGVWDRDFPLDPYLVKGDPTSGLLPLVNPGEPGVTGEEAPGVQAYCYRLCLSTAADRLPIDPPTDYDPKRYELVGRFVEACVAHGDDMDLRWFSKHDALPNEKWDFNTATFGGNLPGLSWAWPEASYDERAQLAQRLEDYHRGLFHFLRTDPRVPEKVKQDLARFGLPADEFRDNGGWPHQVYIREGRRMVGELVMTEHHTFGRSVAPRSVGLGSYGTDTHEIRRIVKDGVVTREGKTAMGRGGAGPYPIGYGAIVPKEGECDNLFSTFALSASHTAFSSLRMEPVFMVTSQSAATAACFAVDGNMAVQAVDYGALKARLVADGQILEWVGAPKRHKLSGIVMDDKAATFTGAWKQSNAANNFVGATYQHDGGRERGKKQATLEVAVPKSGHYDVRLYYTAHANRSTRTAVTIHYDGGQETVRVNQQEPVVVDGVTHSLGIFPAKGGEEFRIVVSNEGADGYVVVDGIQLLPHEAVTTEQKS